MQEMPETRVQSPGREDPLEKEMETQSSILAWRTPWIEGPGVLWIIDSWSRRESGTTEWDHEKRSESWKAQSLSAKVAKDASTAVGFFVN